MSGFIIGFTYRATAVDPLAHVAKERALDDARGQIPADPKCYKFRDARANDNDIPKQVPAPPGPVI